jgi:ribosomal protein S18 acetylase RimI-like enzyme
VSTDVRIRRARVGDCDAIGLVTVTASHSAFIGAIPEEHLDFAWTPTVSAANWRRDFDEFTDRDQLFDVALEGDRVIGFVWARPWADTRGYEASVRGLYILPTRHRLGIGRRLVSHAASAMQRLGAGNLEINCVRENPSCGFYRALGGEEIGRRPVEFDGFETVKILFGWPDIRVLI